MHHIVYIGLGNPGPQFTLTRHNIGFIIIDALADQLGLSFCRQNNYLIASQITPTKKISLIKPQTFMNDSGAIIPFLNKQGIKKEHIIVLHDELELAFGIIKSRSTGSAKGHNGLRSIIERIGLDFERLRFGIGRPEDKSEVGNYVLEKFNASEQQQLTTLIAQVINQLTLRLAP